MPKNTVFSKFVYSTDDGSFVTQNDYYKRWVRYKEHAGIKSQVSPYELRHTFVSIFKDLPEGLMKPIVGHSVKMNTNKTYGHEVDGDLQKAANLMEERFSNLLKKES